MSLRIITLLILIQLLAISQVAAALQHINIPVQVSVANSGSSKIVSYSINDNGLVSSTLPYTSSTSTGVGSRTYQILHAIGANGYAFWIVERRTTNSGNAGYDTKLYEVIGAFYQRNTRSWDVRTLGSFAGGGAYSVSPGYYQFYNFSLTTAQATWTAHYHPLSGYPPPNAVTNHTYNVPQQNPAPVFTSEPVSQIKATGEDVTFSAAATGAVTYQWRKNGGNLSGQTSTTLYLTNLQTYDSGSYTVVATNQGGSSEESVAATLTVTAGSQPPTPSIAIDGFSSGATVLRPQGGAVTVTVRYRATDPNDDLSGIRYNVWNSTTGYFDNGGGGFAPQPGNGGEVVRFVGLNQNGDWYFWTDSQDQTGNYAATPAWTNGFKLTVSEAPPELTPSPNAYLSALSARGHVGTGANVMISGLVVSGSTPETVMIKGSGPSLAQYGVAGPISDPTLSLYNSSGTSIAMNDDWGTAPNASQIASSGGPTNSKESAILTSINPGVYTAMLSNAGGGGIGLLEVYDQNPGSNTKLSALSARAFVSQGEGVLIGGLIIGGGAKRVLITGKGPSLAPHGISNYLANPKITVISSNGAIVASNDNWQMAWNASTISTLPGRPNYSDEAAIYAVLAQGAYTVIMEGSSGSIGIGLLEIYEM